MPYIKSSFVQKLLDRVDIVDVISSRVKLKRSGTNSFTCCCPFHSEKTPSFSVHQGRQFFNCFGCHKAGNAINFIQEYDHVPFNEAIEIIAEMANIDVEYEHGKEPVQNQFQKKNYTEIMETAVRLYEQELFKHKEALEYLNNRGITRETVAKYHIGFAPDNWNFIRDSIAKNNINLQNTLKELGLVNEGQGGRIYDVFRNRLIIPIRDKRGRTVAFGGRVLDSSKPKYINTKESPIYKKGYELFNLDYVRKLGKDEYNYVLVTEGYMDVIALDQYGIHNAVASLGTATTTEQINILLKQTDHIKFCYDGDAAGRKAAWHVLENSLSEVEDDKVFSFCFLPIEHDPDSYVRTYGVDKLREEFDKASSLVDYISSELASRYNLSEISERIRLLNEAAIIASKIPDDAIATKEALKNEIARIAYTSKDEVNIIFNGKKAQSSQEKEVQDLTRKLVNAKREVTKYQWLIAQMVRNPHFYAQIPNPDELMLLLKKYSPERIEVLERILNTIKSKQDITTGSLLLVFQEEPKVINFINYLISLKEESLSNDFNIKVVDLLQNIKDLLLEALSNRNEQLMAKSRQNQQLTHEEMVEYDFLCKKIHELSA